MEPPARTRLRGDVEQLPVEVEAGVGAHEVAGEHEAHQQLLADGERIELLRRDRHQRAGWADDQRGHAGQARGDGVGQRVAVERRGRISVDAAAPKLMKGSTTMEFCLAVAVGAGLAEALGEHGEDAGGALLFLGRFELQAALRGQLRDGVAGHADGVELQRLHDGAQPSRTSAAEAKRAEGCFSRQRRITDFEFDGQMSGTISRRLGGSANWMARMVWNSGRIGAVEGMAAGGELVEDQAEGEDVGLHARIGR